MAPDEVTHHRRGPGIERRDPAVRSSARWKTGRCPYDSRIARSLLSWLERESVFSDGCHSVPGGARGLSGVEPHGRDGSATSRPPAGAHGDAGLSSLGGRTPPPSGPGPRAAPEVRRGRSRVLQDHTERTSWDLRVIGNVRRPSKWMAEVDGTAFPVPDRLARPAERPYRVPSREDRECRGHRRTATRSSPAPLEQRGMPSRARDPRCSPIASATFRFASSSVRPCETQPGGDGTVTTYQPSLSRSIRIVNSSLYESPGVHRPGHRSRVGEEIGGGTAPRFAALERRRYPGRSPGFLPAKAADLRRCRAHATDGWRVHREKPLFSDENISISGRKDHAFERTAWSGGGGVAIA